ncbi:MAG: slipin family protein [Candidatus Nealsonbacteria bacterium]|nr:slipin family protein [Candidatus Nealsonbacteria bacterium]
MNKNNKFFDKEKGQAKIVPILIGLFLVWAVSSLAGSFVSWPLIVLLLILAVASVRINNEWDRAVIFRLGKYVRTAGPGLFFLIPGIEKSISRDVRISTVDIPQQEAITQDNISVKVDAVVFLRIIDAKKNVINIQNFMYAVRQYAQTTLRNVIGQRSLDELLERRKEIAIAIKKTVDEEAADWGVDITRIELQNIELPEDMKRVMARQAEAERERRAVVIKSKGEIEAAENLKSAANLLMESKGGVAVKLREFETISDISYDRSNTIVFFPSGLGDKNMLFGGTALANPTKYEEPKKKE